MDRSPAAERIALRALGITCVLAALKVGVGIATSSLALLSQAVDTGVDVVAIGLVFFAVRVAGRPADESHHYGHGKAENLVAFTQTLLLGAVVIGIAVEAVGRLTSDPPVVAVPWYALALLAVSAVVDAWRARSFVTTARAHGSDAMRAGALNFATDMGTALVALTSLVLVRGGFREADAIGALVVSAAVAVASFRVGKRSVDVLMDRAPLARFQAIRAAAGSAPGVSETRRVRVRGSEEHLFADVTVAAGRTSSLERAHDIAEGVEREIARVAPGTDVVVHVEPFAEASTLVERVQAAASKIEGVQEVHNVLVHSFGGDRERRLHVTLHAKGDPGLSVDEAHDLADRVETQIARELGTGVRVDAHIEPLERTVPGTDVTTERPDIVESLRSLARDETDILDCHEVIVTATGDRVAVVAHVRGRADLSLTRLHDASERIEDALHAAHPDVGHVLIHFEPA